VLIAPFHTGEMRCKGRNQEGLPCDIGKKSLGAVALAVTGRGTLSVEQIVKAYPSIKEVWLIGSGANCTAKEPFDWDYLASRLNESFFATHSAA
jgi:hypothetical protein